MTPEQLKAIQERAEAAEAKLERIRNKCEDHFGERTACGQCFDSLKSHPADARAQLATVRRETLEEAAKECSAAAGRYLGAVERYIHERNLGAAHEGHQRACVAEELAQKLRALGASTPEAPRETLVGFCDDHGTLTKPCGCVGAMLVAAAPTPEAKGACDHSWSAHAASNWKRCDKCGVRTLIDGTDAPKEEGR